jgi:hypothetical protein
VHWFIFFLGMTGVVMGATMIGYTAINKTHSVTAYVLGTISCVVINLSMQWMWFYGKGACTLDGWLRNGAASAQGSTYDITIPLERAKKIAKFLQLNENKG